MAGAVVFIGNRTGDDDGDDAGSGPLHNPRCDFNDRIVPIGARRFAERVVHRLPAG